MAINFTYYPDSNRVPGVYVEMDPSQANTAQTFQRSLVIGQMLATGTAKPEEPLEVQSMAQIQTAVGRGSILAQMAQNYLLGDNFGDLWLLPLLDNPASEAATGTLDFTGSSVTVPGTLNVYIAGIRVQIGCNVGDTPTILAANFAAACATNPDLPVTAVAAAGVVTFTANNKGMTGNDIDIRLNYYGAAGGEFTPMGVTATITAMANGSANPDITSALGNLSDQTYD